MLQALCALVFPIPHGLELGGYIFPPALTGLVYAFVWADARETPLAPRAAWERFLERVWAVIIIDFIGSKVIEFGFPSHPYEDAVAALAEFFAVGVSVFILFADAIATADDEGSVLTLLPRAFAKSVATAFTPIVLVRAVAIFAAQFALIFLESAAYLWLNGAHVAHADFWAQVPLSTLTVPPFAALTLLVYQDATISRRSGSGRSL